MTEDQKKYYKAMKRMQSKSPIKAIPRPNVSADIVLVYTRLTSVDFVKTWPYVQQ